MSPRHLSTVVCLLAVCATASSWATGIYSCVDKAGRRITSDRIIPACLDRDQRLLNKDGSQRAVVPPSQSLSERLAAQKEAQSEQARRQQQTAAVRRDRLLLQRYPDAAAHNMAREKALNQARQALVQSDVRIRELLIEAKKLAAEAEFYKKTPMPRKLREAIDFNASLQKGQAEFAASYLSEIDKVTGSFDAERQYLEKLWAGAPPGSIGDPVGFDSNADRP